MELSRKKNKSKNDCHDSLYSGHGVSEISYSTDLKTYFISGNSGC